MTSCGFANERLPSVTSTDATGERSIHTKEVRRKDRVVSSGVVYIENMLNKLHINENC